VNRERQGLRAVFHQAVSATFSYTVFLKTVSTTFSYTVALKTLSTTFSYTVALKTLSATFSYTVFLKAISTTFSNTTFQQAIRPAFSNAAFQHTVRPTLSHAAVHQAIRAAFSEGRLGKGAYSKYRESEAKQELAFHEGVLRESRWLVWMRCYAADFLRELHWADGDYRRQRWPVFPGHRVAHHGISGSSRGRRSNTSTSASSPWLR